MGADTARDAAPGDGRDGEIDGEIEAVLQAVRAVAIGLDRYRQALGARYALGVAEIVALAQLLYDGPVRASDVSARTGLTQSSVTALLDRLEARGYVTRTRPAANRRVVLVAATPAGTELGRAIFGPMRAALHRPPGDAPPLPELATALGYTADLLGDLAAGLRAAGPS